MGEFNSDDHYIYYCGQESLRRNGVGLIVNKSLKSSTWVQSQNWKNDLVHFQGKLFNITAISLCPNQQCWRSWSWMVLWRLTRPSSMNTQKRCPFHYRGLECKSRKSRNTWNNRKIWPWTKKWSRVLPRECTDHRKYLLPTRQNMTLCMDHYQMVNTKIRLIIFFADKDGEALHSQQKQDRELPVAQIMNSELPNSDLNWRK